MSQEISIDWLKQRKEKMDQISMAAQKADSEEIAARFRIQKYAPTFWRDLLRELQLTSDQLNSLPEVRSSFSSSAGEKGGESSASLHIVCGSRLPKINRVNLFYASGSEIIRCLDLKGKTWFFTLCLDDDQHVVAMERHGTNFMDAPRVVRLIAEDVLDSAN